MSPLALHPGEPMSRRKRRRTHAVPSGAGAAPPLVSWRHRAREVFARLREDARSRQGAALEAHLRARFPGDPPSDADLERAFDDLVCTPKSAGDERSLVKAFAEEAPDLDPAERESLKRWEAERTRLVAVLDRAARERLDLWDPVRSGRVLLHLLDLLPAGRAAALPRGAVVVAVSVPWLRWTVALGPLEVYEDEEAIALFRREVRASGRIWHDLPAAAPTS